MFLAESYGIEKMIKMKDRENGSEFEIIIGNPFGMDVEEVLSDTININHIQHPIK